MISHGYFILYALWWIRSEQMKITWKEYVWFTVESTFHVSRRVHHYNVRIWSSENPCISVKYEQGNPKFNVWYGLLHNALISPFFFAEKVIKGDVYQDLNLYVIPQLEHLQPNVLFQQDSAPPHWTHFVHELLDRVFPKWGLVMDDQTYLCGPWYYSTGFLFVTLKILFIKHLFLIFPF